MILPENPFKDIKNDLPSGLVVFFVSVPLCLGISLASGAPLLAGLISGMVGGIVCGFLSRSPLSITGPAAGLSAVVLYSIGELGSFSLFLLAVVVAGLMQIGLGLVKAGYIARFFPASVIKGLLAGIGLILVFKQIPHALGYDAELLGAEEFAQLNHQDTFTEIYQAFLNLTPGALVISLVSLGIVILSSRQRWREGAVTKVIPGVLVAMLAGVVLNEVFLLWLPDLGLQAEHLVALPHVSEWTSLPGLLDMATINSASLGTFMFIAVTVAVVASIETLMNIEAIDKMDRYRRITPLNRELIVQGATNVMSGFLGGLPVTTVIARSSLNAYAGARTQLSAIIQGVLLAGAVLALPGLLERIPLASLAVILMFTGYRLATPRHWRDMFRKGMDQFIPFVVTALLIFFTNLLTGIVVGVFVALFFVFKSNYHRSILKVNRDNHYLVKLTTDVSFLNKSLLYRMLEEIPNGAHVIVDGTRSNFVDNDIIETIEDFQKSAPLKGIKVEIVKKAYATHPFFKNSNNAQ